MNYAKICRKGGKVEQACDVYISRAYMGSGWNLNRSKWAIPNEFCALTGPQLHEVYGKYITESPLLKQIPELAYQKLGCWCKDANTCHARVLLGLVGEYLSRRTSESDDDKFPRMVVERIPIYRAQKRVRSALKAMKIAPAKPAERVERVERAEREKRAERAEERAEERVERVERAEREERAERAKRAERAEERAPTEIEEKPFVLAIRSPMVIMEHWDKPPFNHPRDAASPPDPISIANTSNSFTIIYKPLSPWKPVAYDATQFVMLKPIGLPKQGFAPNLHKSKTWAPFVCYVAKIIKNKKTERYMMILSDQASTSANNDNSVKVHVASQLLPAIQNKTIVKDDLIYVEDYAITQLGPRKSLIILCHAAKILVPNEN